MLLWEYSIIDNQEISVVDLAASILVILGLHLAMAMTPGPNTLTICSVAGAGSRQDGLSVVAGLVGATGLWVGAALFGMMSLTTRHDEIYVAFQSSAAVLLIWTGVRMMAVSPRPSIRTGPRRPFIAGLLTGLANPLAIAFWTGTFLTAIPRTAPHSVYPLIFILIIVQTTLWYSLLAILSSTAMRGRTFAATRLLRVVAAGTMIVVGLDALLPD